MRRRKRSGWQGAGVERDGEPVTEKGGEWLAGSSCDRDKGGEWVPGSRWKAVTASAN